MKEKLQLLNSNVQPEWVDYNGHMNDSAYALIFTNALEKLVDHVGLDAVAREAYQYTTYTLEAHTCFLQEAQEAQPLCVTGQLLNWDAKRIHLFMEMMDENGETVATSELMLMGMDAGTKKPRSFPEPVMEKIKALNEQQQEIPYPARAGRTIGIPAKKTS